MGYRLPDRFSDIYRLVFADPEYHGLQVRARRASVGAIQAIAALGTIDQDKVRVGQLADLDLVKLDALLTELGEALISWNLLDADDQPVPCTPEQMRKLDLEFVLELVDAWLSGVSQTQLPTRPEPVPENELPMDVLGLVDAG